MLFLGRPKNQCKSLSLQRLNRKLLKKQEPVAWDFFSNFSKYIRQKETLHLKKTFCKRQLLTYWANQNSHAGLKLRYFWAENGFWSRKLLIGTFLCLFQPVFMEETEIESRSKSKLIPIHGFFGIGGLWCETKSGQRFNSKGFSEQRFVDYDHSPCNTAGNYGRKRVFKTRENEY